ncbi:DNA invertase Pin-like site-specific DNA recombinase [Evansella vedderi]|uniref:DNA invertase Pin-like site-specific DNA recombinase n=1 Tax=Evansella vedderi TaxID=38282 RepID=A0ABT9ZSJ0_9BACI|nr:recombinase family protein [Evansella vedderi]MDQ0253940.1 DNA invertase Pin-like site-specific DNA recombinase [Evansella vedderi]
MKRYKYVVFFRRVSGKSQDLRMQVSADSIFREKHHTNEIIIIEEDGVSANKIRLKDRPEMLQLISLIKSNQVDIVYAFDRTRLFRDYYEALYFVTLCKKHNVQIHFTSAGAGHQQATDNSLIEGVMNIIGDVEGKNIARRIEEARRRYPPKKLGFIKDEKRRYIKDPQKKDSLVQYFNTIKQIDSHIQLEEVVQKFKKVLKTTPQQLLKIAFDPFYAGYDLVNGENKLSHVEPYLTLEQHKALRTKEKIFATHTEKLQRLKDLNIYKPVCGICNKPMNFKISFLLDTAWYSCSRKHKKVQLTAQELNEIISKALIRIIDHLDIEKLLKDSDSYFKQLKKPIESELKSIKKDINRILESHFLEECDFSKVYEHPDYKELIELECKQEKTLNEIEMKKELLLENQELSRMVKDYLGKCMESNPFFLSSMLIQAIYAYPNELSLIVNKFDYIENLKPPYIFKGDELLCKG